MALSLSGVESTSMATETAVPINATVTDYFTKPPPQEIFDTHPWSAPETATPIVQSITESPVIWPDRVQAVVSPVVTTGRWDGTDSRPAARADERMQFTYFLGAVILAFLLLR